jgi:hypothetical protein
MIGEVIAAFAPATPKQASLAKLKQSAKQVMDFLIDNPSVSRISILSDCKNPKQTDNTIKSAMLASEAFGSTGMAAKETFVLAFALVSAMQALFLRKDQSKEVFGFDLCVKKQRDKVIELLVDSLFGRAKA